MKNNELLRYRDVDDITEILLKVTLNTINLILTQRFRQVDKHKDT